MGITYDIVILYDAAIGLLAVLVFSTIFKKVWRLCVVVIIIVIKLW